MPSAILLFVLWTAWLVCPAGAQGWLMSNFDMAGQDHRVEVAPAPLSFGGDGQEDKVSHRSKLPTPGDQGETNSCVGWTIAYGMLTGLLERKNNPFSPYYVYRWGLSIKSRAGGASEFADNGLDFWHAFLVLPAEGCCSFGEPQHLLSKRERNGRMQSYIKFNSISSDIKNDGHNNRIFITPQRLLQQGIVDSLKAELSKGKLIPCGFRIHPGLRDGAGLEPLAGKQKNCLWKTELNPANRSSILHAMLIVGYDDNIDAFEVMNSFGPDFADQGFLWISYDLMANLGDDAEKRNDNPCCISAWSYQYSQIVGAFDPEQPQASEEERERFAGGERTGWVKLKDSKNEFNFAKPEAPIRSVEDLKKEDRLVSSQTMYVREAINASGRSQTSSGQKLGELKSGDSVIVQDLRVVSFDGKSENEVWAKVRLSNESPPNP